MAAKKKGPRPSRRAMTVAYVSVKKLRDARKRAEKNEKKRVVKTPGKLISTAPELRPVRVTVLLTEEEGKALAERATSMGRSMSHHLRELLREDRERSET